MITAMSSSHGAADIAAIPEISTVFHAKPLEKMPEAIPSDIASLPPCETWVNAREFGARGDAIADDLVARRAKVPVPFMVVTRLPDFVFHLRKQTKSYSRAAVALHRTAPAREQAERR